jgi:glutaredoxin
MTHAIRLALALSLLALAIPVVLGQTMYKSVTADGKIIYSDHPPSDGKVLKTITPDIVPSTALSVSAMEQLRKLRALRPTAAAPANGIVLYSASWCGYCAKAKTYLAAKGIAYQEIDIDTPDGLASFAHAGGGKGVPLLLSGSQRIQGFSPAAYDQLFSSRQ